MLILPVAVVISHFPPDVVLGTLIQPVEVSVMNTFSESNVPVTSPVSVFTDISIASLPSNLTSPVSLLIEIVPVATTFFKVIVPVSVSISMLFLAVTDLTAISPVVAVSFI